MWFSGFCFSLTLKFAQQLFQHTADKLTEHMLIEHSFSTSRILDKKRKMLDWTWTVAVSIIPELLVVQLPRLPWKQDEVWVLWHTLLHVMVTNNDQYLFSLLTLIWTILHLHGWKIFGIFYVLLSYYTQILWKDQKTFIRELASFDFVVKI